jgi:hypothetical protein
VAEGILERAQDQLKDGRFALCRYQVRAPWLIEAPAACSRCGLPFKLGFERDGAMVCNYCLTGIAREHDVSRLDHNTDTAPVPPVMESR